MQDRDFRQRFLFDDLSVRGELVHLNVSWQEILKRHNYPEVVQNLLGEMAAAAVLLVATLKFDGSLILQIRGSGPLSMLVIEATSDRTLRGLAHWEGDVNNKQLLELVGDATLMVTIVPGDGERYQGIVDFSSGSIALALENYMHRSQQLETRLWLTSNSSQASGMMMQKLPAFDELDVVVEDADAWPRVTQLANTVQAQELSEIEFKNLLHRLFHEEDVRVFEKLPMSFRCSCNRERVCNMLKMLGYSEVKTIVESEKHVKAHCEFCNQRYDFDSVDVEEVFAVDVPAKSTDTMQ